jgi:quercetin dioxygenase-like cupin family protein
VTAHVFTSAEPRLDAKVVPRGEAATRYSLPYETLCFKARGDDTGGALDYFLVEVAPRGGPPLHTHSKQHETLHFLKGRYKIQAGDDLFICEEGAFVYIPPGLQHAFLNLADEPGEVIATFVPGHADRFFAAFGAALRSFEGPPDPAVLEPIFAAADWELNGPPLSAD